MKQLYYTSCRTGKSVGGSSGFQVRAASPGLPGDQVRAAVLYAGYSLPPNIMPSEATRITAPVRLALLDTPDMGRVVCHSAYVGQDPMTGRYGNFFSHLLLGQQGEVDATRAIQTWGSPFWHCQDDDGSTALQDVKELPTAAGLGDADLLRFLGQKKHKEMLQFVLQALLATEPDRRIFVAAPASDVAVCVYAVTRALPRTMLKGFTFSTYEHEPLTCSARLVGSWYGDMPDLDLPSSCYTGTCLAYNSYTGRKSELLDPSPYVSWTLGALASGNTLKTVDKLRIRCEHLQVSDTRLLELTFLVMKDGVEGLSKEDAERILAHHPLAHWLISQPTKGKTFLEKVVHWAKGDESYYRSLMDLAGAAFKEKSDEINALEDLPPGVRKRLNAWVLLDSFLDRPTFDAAKLRVVAEELEQQPEEVQRQTLSNVVKAAAKALFNEAATRNVYPHLHDFLTVVGPSTPERWVGLFRKLLGRYLGGDDKFWHRIHLLHALVAAGLGATSSEDIDHEQLVQEIQRLIEQIKKRGGKKSLMAINNQVRDWDRVEAKRRWRELTKKWLGRGRGWLIKRILVFFLVLVVLLVVEEWLWGKIGLRNLISRSKKSGKSKPNSKGSTSTKPVKPAQQTKSGTKPRADK
jgi:hypothetical protein